MRRYKLIGADGRAPVEAAARAAGYRPCAHCMPEEYAVWKTQAVRASR